MILQLSHDTSNGAWLLHESYTGQPKSCDWVTWFVQGCDDCDNMVQYGCLTYEGQSGSGMWSENNQTIHSIVTGSVTLSEGKNLNVGIQINDFVYNTIVGWFNDDATEAVPFTPMPPTSTASHHPYDDSPKSAS